MQSTATVCGTPTTFTTLVYSDRVLITVSQGLPGFGCLVSAMREPSNGPGGGVGGLTVSRVLGGARAEEADYPSLAARHVALAMGSQRGGGVCGRAACAVWGACE